MDAIFISLQEEIDFATKDDTICSSRPRSTRRSKEVSHQADANAVIPTELRIQLRREGFDVDGTNSKKEKTLKESYKENSKPLRVARQQDRNQSERQVRIARKTKAIIDEKSRKRKSSSGVASVVSQVSTISTANKRKKSPSATKPDLPASLPNWSGGVQCKKADDYYRRHINAAISKRVIYVCSSFLSEHDENLLKELCRQVKIHASTHITVSNSIHTKKTTLCIVPAGIPSGCNLTAERRSMKAMQASLSGIPIVSPSWISVCLQHNKIVIPDANMYVRTLPTKTTIPGPDSADFGVAFLAVAREYSSNFNSMYAPLKHCSVYLFGFSSTKGTNFSLLLREAGAHIVASKQGALAKLRSLQDDNNNQILVIICEEKVTFLEAFEREIRNHLGKVIVVNSDWLVDSISCGVALNPLASYAPHGKAKVLWELTKDVVLR